MRTLVLLRGIPASGKTTWIKEHQLEPYTLSSDTIRRLYEGPVLGIDGRIKTSRMNDKEVWELLTKIAEKRMARGEFLIIDATNILQKDVNKYRTLAKTYRYRIIGVDFTDISLADAMRRNRSRSQVEQVPDEVMEKFCKWLQLPFYADFPFIKPDEFEKLLLMPLDFSKYKKIHHIGDIHGCFDALQCYLKGGLKEDEFYIFHGDYLDRGPDNVNTLKLMMNLSKRENVLLLEGNHERWLHLWAHNEHTPSKEFEEHTAKELEAAGISKKEVRIFYRKLAQCVYYRYHDKVVFGCHGGVSTIPGNPIFLSTEQMIHGVGGYPDVKEAEEMFDASMPNHIYQIHGHRNFGYPVHSTNRNYNLEGKVELGGFLRPAVVSAAGIDTTEIRNTVYRKPETDFSTVHDAIETLRKDPYIKEKKFDSISSFNFSREAFNNRVWNERTVKARGLYLNTKTEELVCRGYDKFFAVDEVEETMYHNLKEKLVFPVEAYVKENGFLGMVSFNKEKDELFITTKSDPTGKAAGCFKDMLYKKLSEETIESLKKYLKEHSETLVFECVDQVNDPHIIDYEDSEVYLLDIIKNEFDFQKKSYEELLAFAAAYHLQPKKLVFKFNTYDEFDAWYQNLLKSDQNGTYTYNGKPIEGFVLEDTNHFMFKLKLNYYKTWKRRRCLLGRLQLLNMAALSADDFRFIVFAKELLEKGIIQLNDPSSNICHVRKLYEKRKQRTEEK